MLLSMQISLTEINFVRVSQLLPKVGQTAEPIVMLIRCQSKAGKFRMFLLLLLRAAFSLAISAMLDVLY